jgi:predicted HTH transcriptional regulator
MPTRSTSPCSWWDVEEGAKSKLVEASSIKTVGAFLNSEFGGTLLIGVGDDGAIVGLEHDFATLRKQGKDDADLFLLHLNQLLENAVGLAAAANVTTTVHRVDGHDICRVHVEPSGHPVEPRSQSWIGRVSSARPGGSTSGSTTTPARSTTSESASDTSPNAGAAVSGGGNPTPPIGFRREHPNDHPLR